MWRPQEVVPQYKRRALLIWVALMAAILSYTVWVIYSGLEQRKNPSTSFAISNDIYVYPDLWVCLYETYGCDDEDFEEQCVNSIFDTEGGSTSARYRPGDVSETLIYFTANLTEERGWCVIFETSALVYNLGGDRDPDDYIDYTRLDMYWYPGGSANNSTTCIQETGAWTSHSENIFAFLKDPVTDKVSAGIQIPYSCMTNESSSHHFTYVGIGVTEECNIGGEETASYNALTIATIEYKDERNANITGIRAPYAYLSMELQQESDSLAIITEIDPFDFAELLGEIGGFWDLILIAWPIFFVALSNEAPNLKARNFRKSALKATETVTKVRLLTMMQSLRASINGRRQAGITEVSAGEGEEMPEWNRAVAPSTHKHEQESEVLIRLFEDHKLIAVVDASSRVEKFLQSEYGARYLGTGAPERSLQKLLPANTYLVEVPANVTVTTVATSIAGHCKTGGDADQARSTPIYVKVMRVSCSVIQAQALAASPYVATTDNKVEESVVDLGEGLVGRVFTPPDTSGEVSQLQERRFLQRRGNTASLATTAGKWEYSGGGGFTGSAGGRRRCCRGGRKDSCQGEASSPSLSAFDAMLGWDHRCMPLSFSPTLSARIPDMR